MRRIESTIFVALVVALAAIVAGCDDAEDVIQTDLGDVQSEVAAGAEAMTLAGPGVEANASMIVDMIGLLHSGPAAMTAGDVAALELPLECPETFELPNGLSGTCSSAPGGAVTFVFGGTVATEGGEVGVEGTLILTPTVEQPATGAEFTFDFDAVAEGPRGTATWSVMGTVVLNEEAEVVDFRFNLTHTVTPTGGESVMVTSVVTPHAVELVVTGPNGGVIRFALDRESLTGEISLNGIPVADVTIVEGCAMIDYYNPAIEDETICPEETT